MCTGISLLVNGVAANAQDLTNEKIFVGANTLTRLKFNSEVTDWDLGSRDNFTCDPRNNRVLIRALIPNPATTNLIIFEGKRSHSFVLVFVKDADPNKVKFDYDFSDLKALRELIAGKKGGHAGEAADAAATASAEQGSKKSRKEEAAERKRNAEAQQQADAALARRQEELRSKELAQQQELKQQQELAAAKEAAQKRVAEERIRKTREAKEAAAAAKAKTEEEKKRAAANRKTAEEQAAAKAKANDEKRFAAGPDIRKTTGETAPLNAAGAANEKPDKKLSRKEERALRKQKEQAEADAAAIAEEARRQEAASIAVKEKARQDELDRQQSVAAEAARKKEEALQKRRDAVAAKTAEKDAARMKQQALADTRAAQQKEVAQKRQEDLKNQKELAAARADLTAYLALRKRYPGINFADIPEGQMYTGDYFRAADTLENYQQCLKMLGEKPALNILSNTVGGIGMQLEGMSFSGVNIFLRVVVHNGSNAEYLAGRMLLYWEKAEGDAYNLYACYVTGYPVIPAKGSATLVYVARGVNAKDEDKLFFRLTDRVRDGNTVEIPFSGKLYNRELLRK